MRRAFLAVGLAFTLVGVTPPDGTGQQAGRVRDSRAFPTGPAAVNEVLTFDPFIPMQPLAPEFWALSAGLPEYWQIRIPYRPVYHSPFKPRFRRTRMLETSPYPFSPTDDFGDPRLFDVDSPRL